MATPAEQARVSRQKYCDDKHADAAEGAIKLRVQEDWIEYYNAEKKSVFYYCTGTNYRTMNRERTPFSTPARPENGPMVEYDEHSEKPAFVPQKKFVSALLSEAPAASEGDEGAGGGSGGSTGAAAIESRVSVSDGAATILKFRDEDREAVAAVSGANKNRALQAQFEEEQRLKRVAEAAEEEKAAKKRRLEEEKEEAKDEAKRRRVEKNASMNDTLLAKWGKKKKK